MQDDTDGFVHDLASNGFILASWVPCANEWYAYGMVDMKGSPITAGTMEKLAEEIEVFDTREEAERASRELY